MICFLSCTKSKKSTRCKAVEMYSESDLFSKAYEYAKSLNPDHIYILSAKHHVLELDDVIEPYNLTLNDFSVEEREEWSDKVIDILKQKNVNFNQKVYFFAGESYTEFIKDHFKNRKEVFSGKGFGEILSFLDKKNESLKNESLTEHLKNKIMKSFMKSLKEYIYEVSLTEGLLDRVKNKDVDHKILVEEFLKENYKIHGSYTIKETKEGFVVNVKSYIEVINKNITSLTNGLFEFGEVGKYFNCECCNNLKSLEGAPKEVGGAFKCDNCRSLTTLEGAPENVGWGFYCSECDLLTSLKGAPQKVGWSFDCSHCESLKTLEGSPKEVGENFDCSHCESLKTLEGAPQKVGKNFYCINCGTQFTEDDVKKYTNVKKRIFV